MEKGKVFNGKKRYCSTGLWPEAGVDAVGGALRWDRLRIHGVSYGAISTMEQSQSFRWGVGSWMWRGRRMQLGE